MRLIIRFSLDNDTQSRVRTFVYTTMANHGLAYFKVTGTLEAAGLSAAQVSAALIDFWKIMQSPASVTGADPLVQIDHVWIYTDK